MRGADSK